MLSSSLLSLLALVPFTRASFYDNPEFDLPPESGTPLDELKAKWDTDVSFFLLTTTTFLASPVCTSDDGPFPENVILVPVERVKDEGFNEHLFVYI